MRERERETTKVEERLGDTGRKRRG